MIDKEYKLVPDYCSTDFNKYYEDVLKDFKNIKTFFPLLNLTILPTLKPKEIYITGQLIPFEIIKSCTSKGNIKRKSIYIRAIYPSDYPENQIVVEDIFKKINWKDVPNEHRHKRSYKDIEIICTHHPRGEINNLCTQDKSIAILHSAWSIYVQYKSYLKTGKWKLKELNHDYKHAIKQLKRIGQYYKK